MLDQPRIDALFDWMVGGALPPSPMPVNVAKLLEGLNEAGVVIDRFALFIMTLDPKVAGKRITWTPNEGVEVLNAPHEFFLSDYFKQSPAAHVYESGDTLRCCFARGDETDFDDLNDLRDNGVTDYYAQPMVYSGRETHSMTWSTSAAGGFTDGMIAAFDRLNPAIARLLEIYVLKINTISILDTYVGRNAGAQVLDGHVERGDLERIPSVILFADLVGFTALSNMRPPEEVLSILNGYFSAVETAVQSGGGEILKFIGDGILAIFPIRDDEAAAAQRALGAIDEALAASETPFRAALHVGEVLYGNIGGESRLDFTAIGPAVNLTARILGHAETAGAELVCSEPFAAHAKGRAALTGEVSLKGFEGAQAVYSL
ncbi:MAG: adenylate/guanylate cyclase domain-containing protein [Pseudomonadota bacterium]